MDAINVRAASKKFGLPRRRPYGDGKGSWKPPRGLATEVVAVDRVSFSVIQGEIFGICGPQGSGKSTLIRLLATQLLPDEGDLHVFGHDVVGQAAQVRRLINPVSGEASFFKRLSPVENLVYGAHQAGVFDIQARRQAEEILVRLGFEPPALHQPLESLERGRQQLAILASALLLRRPLLLLDEPTAGLDPTARAAVHTLLRDLRDEEGVTVLITCRDLSAIEDLCDRAAILQDGKITALSAPAALWRRVPQNVCPC